MNEWQVAQQLAYLIGAQTWPDGASEVVFGANGVYVTAGLAEEAVGRVRVPACIITPIGGTPDDEHPELIDTAFEIIIITFDQSDEIGEHALIGGPLSAGQGSSQGRGLLELQEEVLKAVGQINKTSGVSLKNTHVGQTEAANVPGLGFVATRSFQFSAVLGRERSCAIINTFAAVDNGGGSVTLTWINPLSRFDGPSSLVLRRISGLTPPATSTSGTDVPVSGLPITLTDTPGVGTFSYSMFVVCAARTGSPISLTVVVT